MISISLRTLLLSSVLLSCSLSAQQLTGFWRSEDGSRIYQFNKEENGYHAILYSSSRRDEKPGKLVLDLVRESKNKYVGLIYSVGDSIFTRAKVLFNKKDPNILVLRLKRMFINVTIKWYRVNE